MAREEKVADATTGEAPIVDKWSEPVARREDGRELPSRPRDDCEFAFPVTARFSSWFFGETQNHLADDVRLDLRGTRVDGSGAGVQE